MNRDASLPREDRLHGGAVKVSQETMPRRILVVDDNQDATESLALLLKLWGHETQMAFDGPGAIAMASEFKPDVVLLDIGLPGMDGYEAARRIQELPGLQGVHLVAMTGYGQDEDRERASEAGFIRHMVKPADTRLLRDLIDTLPA